MTPIPDTYEVQFDRSRAKWYVMIVGSLTALPFFGMAYFMSASGLLVTSSDKYAGQLSFLYDSDTTTPPPTTATKKIKWEMVVVLLVVVLSVLYVFWRQWKYVTTQRCTITPQEVRVTLLGTCGAYSKTIPYHQIRDVTINTSCCGPMGSSSLAIDDGTYQWIAHNRTTNGTTRTVRYRRIPTVVFVHVKDLNHVREILDQRRAAFVNGTACQPLDHASIV